MKKLERIKNTIEKKIEKGLKPVCIIGGENWQGLKWCWGIPLFVDVEVEKKDFMKVVCGEKFEWFMKNKPSGMKKPLDGVVLGNLFVHGEEFKNPYGREYMRCTCMKCDTTFIRARDNLKNRPECCPICNAGNQGLSSSKFYICRFDDEKVSWEKWKANGGK